ncbi:hypothetical protein DPEC_G00298210 [Dallia pectoralis]|uniref:Uncharacterized protein n=1 Tax=Dallia pectoralis TaxID=75939 RepID=A0ACC2FFW4_DALPE|nr:hypothetical protein DPEC_G00298210 [Dallia pectoralis]
MAVKIAEHYAFSSRQYEVTRIHAKGVPDFNFSLRPGVYRGAHGAGDPTCKSATGESAPKISTGVNPLFLSNRGGRGVWKASKPVIQSVKVFPRGSQRFHPNDTSVNSKPRDTVSFVTPQPIHRPANELEPLLVLHSRSCPSLHINGFIRSLVDCQAFRTATLQSYAPSGETSVESSTL